ncbi:hypothetical protein BELL_1362g00010 [Botrytis elliptica]|uniref:Uncharacterized protein n=1 Tax=Botrytis elliptica TaxID=278938 RepID=A0A4Z1I725_9HELO|nr:hypothetical protein BELL_1362g00010 [Botrytis elliptica]
MNDSIPSTFLPIIVQHDSELIGSAIRLAAFFPKASRREQSQHLIHRFDGIKIWLTIEEN